MILRTVCNIIVIAHAYFRATNVICLSLDMSRFISNLLAKEKTAVKSTLEKLEMASGENSNDSRLISEIIIKSKLKLKQLGLDPEDTTPEELYLALTNLAALHDRFLAKSLGANDYSDVNDLLLRIVKYSNSIAANHTIWVVKHAVAKGLLKSMPPKTLMKKLGYRSVDSMLKREKIDDLFAGIKVLESEDFRNKFYQSFKKLRPSDFELRKMAVRYLPQKKWLNVSREYVLNNKTNVIELKELGSIILMPLPVRQLKGVTLLLLPLLLHNLNEIQLNSSYFKFFQVRNDFGEIISQMLNNNEMNNVSMVGQELSWSVISEHFGKLIKSGLSDEFEPHIQLDDLEKNSVEECLYNLEPALHFWFGNDCLGLPFENTSVSFNLMDVAANYSNDIKLGNNCTKFLNQSLWDELLKRYLKEEPLQEQVLQQLDDQMVEAGYSDGGVANVVFA